MECPMNLKAVSRLVFPFFVLILFVAISLAFTGCSNAEAAKAEHISRGEADLSDKRYPEASLEFRSALQMDDKSGLAHWGLARAFEGMQRFNEAFEELRRTVELDK